MNNWALPKSCGRNILYFVSLFSSSKSKFCGQVTILSGFQINCRITVISFHINQRSFLALNNFPISNYVFHLPRFCHFLLKTTNPVCVIFTFFWFLQAQETQNCVFVAYYVITVSCVCIFSWKCCCFYVVSLSKCYYLYFLLQGSLIKYQIFMILFSVVSRKFQSNQRPQPSDKLSLGKAKFKNMKTLFQYKTWVTFNKCLRACVCVCAYILSSWLSWCWWKDCVCKTLERTNVALSRTWKTKKIIEISEKNILCTQLSRSHCSFRNKSLSLNVRGASGESVSSFWLFSCNHEDGSRVARHFSALQFFGRFGAEEKVGAQHTEGKIKNNQILQQEHELQSLLTRCINLSLGQIWSPADWRMLKNGSY